MSTKISIMYEFDDDNSIHIYEDCFTGKIEMEINGIDLIHAGKNQIVVELNDSLIEMIRKLKEI